MDLGITDEHIYVSSFYQHRAGRMPIGETTPSWYTPDIDAPAAIAFDATHLYWTSRNVISKTPLPRSIFRNIG
jgi:hypothetical protein